jgi:single-stranded DNA-binding protein
MPDTHVTIVGNLTDDPEVTFTPNGAAVTNFRLAVTARIKDGEGWRDCDTSFYASPLGVAWPPTSATPWPRATG